MQIGGKLIKFSEIGEMVNFVEIAGGEICIIDVRGMDAPVCNYPLPCYNVDI